MAQKEKLWLRRNKEDTGRGDALIAESQAAQKALDDKKERARVRKRLEQEANKRARAELSMIPVYTIIDGRGQLIV